MLQYEKSSGPRVRTGSDLLKYMEKHLFDPIFAILTLVAMPQQLFSSCICGVYAVNILFMN